MKSLRIFLTPFVIAYSILAVATATHAQTLEIDWKIVLMKPDPVSVSPQISLLMSATDDLDTEYAIFRVNPCEPLQKGGLISTVWYGPETILATSSITSAPLSLESDVITLTTQIHVDVSSGTTSYRISAFHSDEWGTIDPQYLPSATVPLVKDVKKLANSIAFTESHIGSGAGRVAVVAITAGRWIKQNGNLQEEDTNVYILHQHSSSVQSETTSTQLQNNTAY